MTFAPGDEVHVASLGKGIVREVRNGARYLVDLKGRSIVAAERQLTPVTAAKRSASRDADTASQPRREPQVLRTGAPSSLDLHGMTVEEATGALDAFVNDALLAGLAEARVIHGRSGGRLKAAVHARLKQLPSVRHFRVDPANAGVTLVSF
jgi:dsDNA-specific endonuclease/ATPase MutS2